jgi:hypothetical protein
MMAQCWHANHDTADSPNIHEQVPGAIMQKQVEVAGLKPAADTGPAGQLQTGCRRSTCVWNAVQRYDPTPK